MLIAPIALIEGVAAGNWPVIADIDPQTRRIGCALHHDLQGGIAALQPGCSQHMGLDLPIERNGCEGAAVYLSGQGRGALRNLCAQSARLPVEGLALTAIREK